MHAVGIDRDAVATSASCFSRIAQTTPSATGRCLVGNLWYARCTMARMSKTMAVIAVALLATACASDDPNASERAVALERWSSGQHTAYTFTWQEGCFCEEQVTNPIRIAVRDNAIATATYAADGTAVPEYVRTRLRTIDGVFDWIDDLVDSADELAVTYHSELGYPTSVTVDRYKNAADDETQLSISNVVMSP